MGSPRPMKGSSLTTTEDPESGQTGEESSDEPSPWTDPKQSVRSRFVPRSRSHETQEGLRKSEFLLFHLLVSSTGVLVTELVCSSLRFLSIFFFSSRTRYGSENCLHPWKLTWWVFETLVIIIGVKCLLL